MGDSWSDVEKELRKSDADYLSAAGWETRASRQELIDRARKKNPRDFAAEPEMLFSRPVSEWLEIAVKGNPMEQLFGPFWLKEELSILFAGTGVGKSALATQIAESLARGIPIPPFDNSIERQRVLYLDFELSMTQLAMRYSPCDEGSSKSGASYAFADNFIRSEMLWNGRVIEGYDGFSDMFFQNIDNEVDRHQATVLIVDNITFLDRTSTSNANTALSIMRGLNILKRHRFISVLVLAHTPKQRSRHALTEFDLQGSVNVANFADSIFAMGGSRRDPSLRYLKQVKVRSGRLEHGADCIPVYRLAKFDHSARAGLVQNPDRPPVENFLGFEFVEFGSEEEHLEEQPKGALHIRPNARSKRKNVVENVKMLARDGKSNRKIAVELGISRTSVARYLGLQ